MAIGQDAKEFMLWKAFAIIAEHVADEFLGGLVVLG